MKRFTKNLSRKGLHLCLWIGVFSGTQLIGQQTGTLVLDLKPYIPAPNMPAKAQVDIEHAGIRWGMQDHTLLVVLVNQKYVNADLPYLTRFGEQKTLHIAPGDYTLTCIGWEFSSLSADFAKNMAKSAFFNNDILQFTILPGKTTTIQLTPVYKAESHQRILAKITFWLPDFKTLVLEDGTPKGDEVIINQRTQMSISWNDYHGPLKF